MRIIGMPEKLDRTLIKTKEDEQNPEILKRIFKNDSEKKIGQIS